MVRIAWPRCLQARLELLHRLWEKIERRVVKYVIPPLLEREERMRLERLRMLAVEESNLALKRVRLEVEELISTRVDNDGRAKAGALPSLPQAPDMLFSCLLSD